MKSVLKAYRKANDKSLQELAVALGVNKSTILRWETGKVPVDRLAEIERVTKISRRKLRPDIFGDAA